MPPGYLRKKSHKLLISELKEGAQQELFRGHQEDNRGTL